MDLVLDGFIRFFADNGILVGGVDLFCGSGGSSWGAHRAGLRVLVAIDKCQRAVNYYNINESLPHFDAYASGLYRAAVFGPAILVGDPDAPTSITVYVGMGDLGVAFHGGSGRSAWRVRCLRLVMDRPGPLEVAGIRAGMYLTKIDSRRLSPPA